MTCVVNAYSTVTDFARLRGWPTSQPRMTAMLRANSCNGTLAVMATSASRAFGMQAIGAENTRRFFTDVFFGPA